MKDKLGAIFMHPLYALGIALLFLVGAARAGDRGLGPFSVWGNVITSALWVYIFWMRTKR